VAIIATVAAHISLGSSHISVVISNRRCTMLMLRAQLIRANVGQRPPTGLQHLARRVGQEVQVQVAVGKPGQDTGRGLMQLAAKSMAAPIFDLFMGHSLLKSDDVSMYCLEGYGVVTEEGQEVRVKIVCDVEWDEESHRLHIMEVMSEQDADVIIEAVISSDDPGADTGTARLVMVF